MMMDKAYILENGILEQYLLGELNKPEEIALEELLSKDNELKAIFSDIESNFEAMALENAIDPPEVVKRNLMNAVKPGRTKVVTLQKQHPLKNYLAIASSVAAILLIGSIWIYSQLNGTKQQLQIATEDNTLLKNTIQDLKDNLDVKSTYLDILNSADTKQYILNGNALSPEAKVVSYVNHQQKQVIINTSKLPKLDAKHDYQMWADVEGEMINMGVIKKDTPLLAMNYIDHAESLNITIEPSGGSDHPTVSQLITNVYL